MNEIFVTGHRNPDTDSIVAAMSYAALRNALGDRQYVAAHLGHISDETNRMLKHFGFNEPMAIRTVRTQVRDLEYDTPPCLSSSVTMDRAWHVMREQRISAVPVVNDDGTLYGMLSAGDIATFSMETLVDSQVEELPVFNLVSVLEGRIVNEGGRRAHQHQRQRCGGYAPGRGEPAFFRQKQYCPGGQPAGYDPAGPGSACQLPDHLPCGC